MSCNLNCRTVEGLSFKDIVLQHNKSVLSSRSDADISIMVGNYKYAAPVFLANMKAIATPQVCKIFDDANWPYVYHRIDGPQDVFQFVIDAQSWKRVSISVGIQDHDIILLKSLKQSGLRVDMITVDVALSYTDAILPVLRAIKDNYPECYLIVGNGVSGEWIQWLESLDMVNAAKVNVGVSTSCRTRERTGFSCGTVSNLAECVEAASSLDIISDGGITIGADGDPWEGDVAKAISLGAIGSMSGALWRSCIDSPSLIGQYYGNSTSWAKGNKRHDEGALVEVRTNGYTIRDMMKRVDDSLRSSVSYSGGRDLKALQNCGIIVLS
jgi:GMP reductase